MQRSIFAFALLIAAAGCRTSSAPYVEVKEATSKGFEYDDIVFELLDVNGEPVPGVGVTYSSFHWSYQLFHTTEFIPIPVYDPKWVEKKGATQVIGITGENGMAQSGPFSIKAKGILPGNSPSGFSLGYFDQLPKPCKGKGGVFGVYNVGALTRVSSVPERPGETGCTMALKADEDTYRVLELHCKSSLTAAEIAKSRQDAVAHCAQD